MESTPPRLSTGSLDSLTWLGTKASAASRATTASGNVTRNTEPHQKWTSSPPAMSGPSDEIAPPVPDHRAIDFVRAGPDHNAVINASVVGYAIPADSPPSRRAPIRTSADDAQAAIRQAGTDRTTPRISIILRPYRSPTAPR
jgi:hypothetical protein